MGDGKPGSKASKSHLISTTRRSTCRSDRRRANFKLVKITQAGAARDYPDDGLLWKRNALKLWFLGYPVWSVVCEMHFIFCYFLFEPWRVLLLLFLGFSPRLIDWLCLCHTFQSTDLHSFDYYLQDFQDIEALAYLVENGLILSLLNVILKGVCRL